MSDRVILDIREFRSDTPLDELLWLDGERERPVQLCLDLEDGRLWVEIDAEYPSEREDVYYGRTLTWSVPVLTPAGANCLLEAVSPDARTILEGAVIVSDERGNATARLGVIAEAACRRIDVTCDSSADFGPLIWMDASDWDDSRTVRDGVRADMTDEALAIMATDLQEEASADVLVVGLPEYLRECRALAAMHDHEEIP